MWHRADRWHQRAPGVRFLARRPPGSPALALRPGVPDPAARIRPGRSCRCRWRALQSQSAPRPKSGSSSAGCGLADRSCGPAVSPSASRKRYTLRFGRVKTACALPRPLSAASCRAGGFREGKQGGTGSRRDSNRRSHRLARFRLAARARRRRIDAARGKRPTWRVWPLSGARGGTGEQSGRTRALAPHPRGWPQASA